jgi:sugar lactone lactonase YvrE
MLWVALWEGAKVTRWNPANGELLKAIPLTALNVTSCVFGGENLTDLYITSACKGLDAGQLKDYPLSGALFRLRTNTQGMPTFAFAG